MNFRTEEKSKWWENKTSVELRNFLIMQYRDIGLITTIIFFSLLVFLPFHAMSVWAVALFFHSTQQFVMAFGTHWLFLRQSLLTEMQPLAKFSAATVRANAEANARSPSIWTGGNGLIESATECRVRLAQNIHTQQGVGAYILSVMHATLNAFMEWYM